MAFDQSSLKNYLKIIGDTDDALLADLVTYIDSEVEFELNRKFDKDVITDELINGIGTPILLPKYFPVISVEKIEVYEGLDSLYAEVWTKLAVGLDYSRILIEGNGAKIHVEGHNFPRGTQSVRVAYTYGYVDPPAEISHAKLDLGVLYYQAIRAGKFLGKLSVNSGSNSGLTETIDTGARKKVYDRINKFRKLNV